MLRYECDNCQVLKEDNQLWILGFAAERIGAVSARRELTMVSRWDERAVDPLAVHFCSEQCRDEYVEAIFGRRPDEESLEEVEAELPIPPKRVAAKRSSVKRPPRKAS